MLGKILVTLRWSVSIGNKFIKVVPRETSIVVFSTLVSQVSILLAFLLPLKILMLLGSSGIPRYFPSSFANVDRDLLVILLSLSAVGFYLLHLLSERIIAFSADRGAKLLLERSQKIVLFEKQEEVAKRGYHRYARSLAGSVFLFLVAIVLAWLYFELLAVLVGYSIAIFTLLVVFYTKQGKLKESLDEEPDRIVSTMTSVGFLLAFGFMVMQFLLGTPPGLLVAIISLILMRQGFSRITGITRDLKGLYSQRFKLNALFFHGHVLVKESKKHETSFWSFLQTPLREEWLLDALREAVSHPAEKIEIYWWQLGSYNVVALRLKVFDCKGEKIGEYLVKLFNANRGSLAKHEATLLSGSAMLPALPLIKIGVVNGFHYHLFEWIPAKRLPLGRAKLARQKINENLLALEPEKSLVSQFSRSRPPIWQRIDSRMLEHLRTVAEMLSSDLVGQVDIFCIRQEAVVHRLKRLPLTVINPDLGVDDLIKTENNEFLLLQWGRWSLEPVGASWPIQPKQLERLSHALAEAREIRHTLRDISFEDACIAALLYAFEKRYSRQDFVGALKLIPRILRYLETTHETSKASV